jgi:Family of unknown function (DUF6167)
MRRGLWFVVGAGAGAYAMIRGRRAAEAFTAEGLADRWHALGLGARMLRDEVAAGKAEAESRLRERFGPAKNETFDDTPQLSAPTNDRYLEEGPQ